jgi:c-di-GMP-binding flagellar brake protein YcgR
MTWEGINQRKFPRVSYKCLIRVARPGYEDVIETFTENVGSGGICVVLEKNLGLFETVAMDIFIDEMAPPTKCHGTVVWVVKRHPGSKYESEKYDTGIEFQDISDVDRERITRLVQDILESES